VKFFDSTSEAIETDAFKMLVDVKRDRTMRLRGQGTVDAGMRSGIFSCLQRRSEDRCISVELVGPSILVKTRKKSIWRM